MPPRDNLALLARLLAGLQPGPPPPAVPALQPPWPAPRELQLRYPVAAGAETARRSFCVLAWLCCPVTEVAEALWLQVLVEALVGSAAGPLRKALIDSGLGEDLYPPHACETETLQLAVRFGLRGTEPEHAGAIEQLVLGTLARLAEQGLDRELLEASLHQVELAGREIVPPFPILLLSRASRLWYYGADPKDGLRFGEQLAALRRRLAAEPDLPERTLRRWLLDNPHRLRLVARPDPELFVERERALRARLAELSARLDAAERQRLAERARALRAAQATPDPPAALARLPRLEPHQVPRAVRRLPTEMREHAGVPILEHPVFANGMVYLGLAFDTAELEEELVALLPLFGLATTEMGAAGLDYEQMARRIQRYTGGVWSELVAGAEVHTGAPRERLLIDGKALAHNGHQLVAIVRDLVGAPDPHDAKRLGDLVREAHARAEAALIPRGTRLAILRAARGLGRRFRRREQWAGVSQLLFLRALAATLAEELPQLIERLETLGRRLLVRQRLLVSVAGDPQSIAALRAEIDALIEALPAAGGGSGAVAPDGRGPAGTAASGPVAAGAERAATEGIAIASEVAFAARLLPVAPITSEAAPALELLAHVLSLDYLYQRIRVQGGAYGGWCQYGQEDGVLVMASYRDPHLEETLQVFDGVWAFARERLDDAALEAVRLGALAPGLRPPSPAEVLSTARRRWLLGIDDELRQRLRDGLFELDAAAVRRLALPVLEQGLAAAGTAALAARERLLAAARALQLPLTITEAS
ncbi:MAG: hypothetical protein KatS3mg102_1474 [Planctomycetota bacterium]|nr:MAG: hypothetical protein KatS3mg102_1474 [Planctomycetota bacterium]